VTQVELLSNDDFANPGNKLWKDVIEYTKRCASLKQSRRVKEWPSKIILSIGASWKTLAPDDYRDETFTETSWQNMPKEEFTKWMENLNKQTATIFTRKDRYQAFLSLVLKHPLSLDVSGAPVAPTNNNIRRVSLILKDSYREFQKMENEPMSYVEEKDASKIAWRSFHIDGMSDAGLEQTKSGIKEKLKLSDSGSPTQFEPLIDEVLDATTRLLVERQSYNKLYTVTASTSSSSSHHDNGKSSSNRTKKRHEDTKSPSHTSGHKGQGKQTSSHSSSDKHTKPKGKGNDIKCYGCGYGMKQENNKLTCTRKVAGFSEKGCKNDPRRSKQNGVAFADSDVGKKWVALGFPCIPGDASITLANAKEKKQAYTKTGTNLYTFKTDKLLQNELIPFALHQEEQSSAKRRRNATPPPVGRLLLDTGAIGSNVMSNDYAKKLRKHKSSYSSSAARHCISTPANNKLTSNKVINIKLNLENERTQPASMQVDVEAAVAPIDVDLIIDRDTIKRNNLVQLFPSHFAEGELLERIQALPLAARPSHKTRSLTATIFEAESAQYATLRTMSINPTEALWTSLERDRRETTRSYMQDQIAADFIRNRALQEDPLTIGGFLGALSALPQYKKIKHKVKMAKRRHSKKGTRPRFNPRQQDQLKSSHLATMSSKGVSTSNFSDKSPYEREGKLGLDEIPDNKLESIPTELLREVLEDNEYTQVHIGGPPELRDLLRRLVAEFKEIFKSSVQSTPSTAFKPFELTVDHDMWERPSNATPSRTLGRERAVELDLLLDILLKNDIVEDCTDSYYSHAFLTPKSNGKWRMVLDFKGLNRATTSKYAWPIPNIKDMLTRVGESRPEFFAVFDLTSGYYQAPIAEESRKYTAFKTRNGVYRWKRLPMGLTDAGSYFQHQLTNNVLNGLIHNICELYLDDCMVYASSTEEYVARLRLVFQRFREHKITLNPSKCHLGLTQVEYVGHTINKNGLHFTRDKLDSVLNFPRPQSKKHVKSFLGLANYFRDHIKNHSMRVQPLQDLVEGYDKSKSREQVVWTDECNRAFEDIRQAIDECPLLWFVDDHSPIFLKTDASDYGIGAYLYQVVTDPDGNEVEHPIGFISKSLVSGHDSWDVPMKEGFAIFYALRKWEYLLRDRKFTVLTDHENLTRLRTERNTNKMVTRWFMAYQEYDIIDWIHVPGVENEVPDSFSRLCASTFNGEKDQHATSILFQLTGYEMDPKHWEIIRTKAHGHSSDRGHGGVKRTLAILDEQDLDWPGRTKDVRKFIKMCPCCQKMSVMKPVIHSYPFTLSTYGLFNTVSVDLIERLRVDDYGMTMVVVIIDNFSRFVDLYPISSTNAEAAADALIQFTGRFQTPTRFTTDSGSNFGSTLVQGLMKRLGADHQLTKAYSKEQNGIVERVNKEVLSHLKAIIFDKRLQQKWSKYLPIVQRYINTSRHSATGCTPAEIVFPSGAQIDKELLTDDRQVVVSAYIKDMQEAQGRIIALAEAHLRLRDQEHLESKKGKEPEFKEGDYVLTEHRHNSLRRGPMSKLLPFLKGPLLVVKKLTEGMYTLRDLITMRLKNFHVLKMRPFLFDERTLQPMQVAAADSFDEFIVEQVLDWKGDPRKGRSTMQFLVRWAGYGPEDDTWVSWKDGRKCTAIQTYLFNHSSRRLRALCMKGFDPNNLDDGLDAEDDSENESDH
jgi:hypothetical protein